jgi:hypothetical protein
MRSFITAIADAFRATTRERVIRYAPAGCIVHVRETTELGFAGTIVTPDVPLVLMTSVMRGRTSVIVRWEGRGNYDIDVTALAAEHVFPGWEEAARLTAPRPRAVQPAMRARTITEYIREEPAVR